MLIRVEKFPREVKKEVIMVNSRKAVSVDRMFVIRYGRKKGANCIGTRDGSNPTLRTARKSLHHGKLTRRRTVKVVLYLQA